MTIFEDLQSNYDKQREALTKQHNLLQISVRDLILNLPNYLGLVKSRLCDKEGRGVQNYVRLGTDVDGEFVEIDWTSLSSTDGVIQFILGITIDSAINFARKDFYYNISVKFCDDGYQFDIEGFFSPAILSVAEVKSGDFSQIYKYLISNLQALLSPSYVLIKE